MVVWTEGVAPPRAMCPSASKTDVSTVSPRPLMFYINIFILVQLYLNCNTTNNKQTEAKPWIIIPWLSLSVDITNIDLSIL